MCGRDSFVWFVSRGSRDSERKIVTHLGMQYVDCPGVARFQETKFANDDKLLKEGAAAFLMKSAKAWEDNSAVLIQAIERVLTGTTARI